jgi:hypothetical protein
VSAIHFTNLLIVVAVGVVSKPPAAGLIAAGLLSVIVFPVTGLALPGGGSEAGAGARAAR